MPSFDLTGAVVGRGQYLRPTAVRESGRFGGQNIGIEIIGLRDALKIPEELSLAFTRMMLRLQQDVQTAARSVVPGSPEGRLGRTVHARLFRGGGVSNRVVVGTFGSEFARALNFGFTSTVKTGKSLRGFEDEGSTVFTRRVRVAGRHFFEKWLVITPPIVEAVYERSFYNIKDLL